MKEQNPYMRGLKRNSLYNLIAGIILAVIIAIIGLLTGCEQPQLPENNPENKSNIAKDSIESWDNDTTAYHSDAKPS